MLLWSCSPSWSTWNFLHESFIAKFVQQLIFQVREWITNFLNLKNKNFDANLVSSHFKINSIILLETFAKFRLDYKVERECDWWYKRILKKHWMVKATWYIYLKWKTLIQLNTTLTSTRSRARSREGQSTTRIVHAATSAALSLSSLWF